MVNSSPPSRTTVSVVVPFFNRSFLLERLLDSVCSQTFPVTQIYLLDNGSCESEITMCSDIVDSYLKRGVPLVWLSTVKKGNANIARNLGFDLAQTTYVAFLDSDDWWRPKHLESSVAGLAKSGRTASYSGSEIHRPDCIKVVKSIDVNNCPTVFGFLYGKKKVIAQTSSYVIKKDSIQSVRWDESLKRHQDTDFFLQVYFHSCGWHFVPSENVVFDVASDGIKKVDFKSMIRFLRKWQGLMEARERRSYCYNQVVVALRRKAPARYVRYYKKAYVLSGVSGSCLREIMCGFGYFEGREKLIKLLRSSLK